ncbi:MAG: twin-arginine translocase TatA/TatE family subunit [Acidimicrobiaceae bacterium]
MFDLSPIKIIVIIAVALLLLGPDKLPEVAAKLGSAWSSLKNIQRKIESEVREVVPDLPSAGDIARIARNPVNMLNKLAEQSDEKEITAKIVADLEAKQAAGEEVAPLVEALPIVPTDLAPAPDTTLVENTPQTNDPSMN